MSFEAIYNCALTQDKEELKIALSESCIDVRRGASTTISILAKAGNQAAVDFLLKAGASKDRATGGYAEGGHIESVNRLLAAGANKDWAAGGYALGGHIESVNALLAAGANKDWAVRGYAEGGHIASVDALLAAGAGKDSAVYGYALGGHIESVNTLLAAGANKDWAVSGYAEGGHIESVNTLLAAGANKDWAVSGYAEGGYIASVNTLLAAGANKDEAVSGYALGGHIASVDALLAAGARKDSALSGYARGGHIASVNRMLAAVANKDGADRYYKSNALLYYAEGGHIEAVNRLLAAGANQRWCEASDYKISAAFGYSQGGHIESDEFVLRLIALTVDTELQDRIAEKIKKSGGQKAFRKGRKLQLLINHDLPFNSALTYMDSPVLRTWLMFYQALVRKQERICSDVFFHIGTFLGKATHEVIEDQFFVLSEERLFARHSPEIEAIAARRLEISTQLASDARGELSRRIHWVACEYHTSNRNPRCSFFYQDGKKEHDRVEKWIATLSAFKTQEALMKAVTGYLSDQENGNTDPHSFRTMLLDALLNGNAGQTLKRLKEISEQFETKLEILSPKRAQDEQELAQRTPRIE